ncbi:MAG TPA: ABC transporter permease [Acidimicrobiales bacterium]|nr:ABC transporter permease [Acidimicrobiales bacterium]
MIALIRVNLRRSVGNRKILFVATLFPILIILVTGLLEGSPREPVGLLHPSPRLLSLARQTDGIKVRLEADRADLTDDILRGRVVAGIIGLPARGDALRVDFVDESATTDAVQARTDVVALLDLIAAEGTHVRLTDHTLAITSADAPLSPFAYVAPANLVLFVSITVLVLAAGLVETRRIGMLRRMAAAPLRRPMVVAGQMASLMVTAAAQCVGLLFVGIVLFGVDWGSPAALVLLLGFLSICVSALSVLIGARSRSQEHAIAVAVIVAILSGMLGGCVYQLSSVSTTVREVGHVVPQAWAMDGLLKLIYDHAGFGAVLPDIGVLAAFAVALSALALRAYSRTLRSAG